MVSFATADASQIPPLESFKGDCEPVFLAYGGGEMVGKMVGCNAPIIERTIKDLAQIEKDVLDGKKRMQLTTMRNILCPVQIFQTFSI